MLRYYIIVIILITFYIPLSFVLESTTTRKKGKLMKFHSMFRAFVSANVILLFTFAILPALVINPDLEFLQNFINDLNKE